MSISESVFSELDGQEFPSYRQLEETVVKAFNRHLDLMPPNYSYRQLINLAKARGWIMSLKGGHLRVDIRADHDAKPRSIAE